VVSSSKIFLVYGTDKKPVIAYSADFSKSPVWFDFVVKDSTRTVSVKSLLLLEPGNILKWQVFEDGKRPNDFAPDRGNVLTLRKQE
jgi:hypothetical protein